MYKLAHTTHIFVPGVAADACVVAGDGMGGVGMRGSVVVVWCVSLRLCNVPAQNMHA